VGRASDVSSHKAPPTMRSKTATTGQGVTLQRRIMPGCLVADYWGWLLSCACMPASRTEVSRATAECGQGDVRQGSSINRAAGISIAREGGLGFVRSSKILGASRTLKC
jgi:hypothetical protein